MGECSNNFSIRIVVCPDNPLMMIGKKCWIHPPFFWTTTGLIRLLAPSSIRVKKIIKMILPSQKLVCSCKNFILLVAHYVNDFNVQWDDILTFRHRLTWSQKGMESASSWENGEMSWKEIDLTGNQILFYDCVRFQLRRKRLTLYIWGELLGCGT